MRKVLILTTLSKSKAVTLSPSLRILNSHLNCGCTEQLAVCTSTGVNSKQRLLLIICSENLSCTNKYYLNEREQLRWVTLQSVLHLFGIEALVQLILLDGDKR